MEQPGGQGRAGLRWVGWGVWVVWAELVMAWKGSCPGLGQAVHGLGCPWPGRTHALSLSCPGLSMGWAVPVPVLSHPWPGGIRALPWPFLGHPWPVSGWESPVPWPGLSWAIPGRESPVPWPGLTVSAKSIISVPAGAAKPTWGEEQTALGPRRSPGTGGHGDSSDIDRQRGGGGCHGWGCPVTHHGHQSCPRG